MNNMRSNIVMMYSYNIARIAFPFVLVPYLTRIFSSEIYGTYIYINAVLTYLRLIIDYGFEFSGTRDIAKSTDIKLQTIILRDIVISKVFLWFIGCIILSVYAGFSDSCYFLDGKYFLVLSFVECFLEIFFIDFYFCLVIIFQHLVNIVKITFDQTGNN